MKRIQTIGLIVSVLFCCLFSSCGKDDLEDKYSSITGTWGETECVGYMSIIDNLSYLDAEYDPYAPKSYTYELHVDDGTVCVLIPCYKCMIKESQKGNYTLTIYQYSDYDAEWEHYMDGVSTDGKTFTFPESPDYTFRILTGSNKKLNAAFISNHDAMLTRLTFVSMN